jgi:hypothetical protein
LNGVLRIPVAAAVNESVVEHSLPVFADALVSGFSYGDAQHTIRFPSFFRIE